MLRRRTTKPGNIWIRLGIFAFGLLITYAGTALFNRGVFAYRNHYSAEVYSPAVAATGVVFMILAVIPDSLVERLTKRARR